MATIDRVRDPLINEYYDNSAMLDCSLAIEGFLCEVVALYPYKNWFDGEVVAGPSVKKYWVTIILKYDYKKMPDPMGAAVLVKLGCKVFYKKAKQKVEVEVVGPQDLDQRHRPKMTVEPCWLIKIVIPKKFIENEELKGIDELDKDIDVDQVEDTMNSGDENSALKSNDEELGQEPQENNTPTQSPAPEAAQYSPIQNQGT